MSDLIRREDAVSRVSDLLMFELQGKRLPTWNEVYRTINDIPSAEPERSAKAEYSNIDGEYLCKACGRVVQIEDVYCCGCGAKLEWK